MNQIQKSDSDSPKNSITNMLNLYIIRHAESELNNKPEIIAGRSNENPLSDKGILQANRLGQRLKNSSINFNQIYSSTAVRALETAKVVGQHLGYTSDEILKTKDLLEIDQGEWTGKQRSLIYTPEVITQINQDNWNFKAPGGESQRDVEERAIRFLDQKIKPLDSEQLKSIAIFTHGFVIRCLLRGIMNSSSKNTYTMKIDNTSITKMQYQESKDWRVQSINDSTHLSAK